MTEEDVVAAKRQNDLGMELSLRLYRVRQHRILEEFERSDVALQRSTAIDSR